MKTEDKIKIDRGIRRQVDLDLGVQPPKTKIHKNKRSITENLNTNKYGKKYNSGFNVFILYKHAV